MGYINTNHPDFIGGSRAVSSLMEQMDAQRKQSHAQTQAQAHAHARNHSAIGNNVSSANSSLQKKKKKQQVGNGQKNEARDIGGEGSDISPGRSASKAPAKKREKKRFWILFWIVCVLAQTETWERFSLISIVCFVCLFVCLFVLFVCLFVCSDLMVLSCCL